MLKTLTVLHMPRFHHGYLLQRRNDNGSAIKCLCLRWTVFCLNTSCISNPLNKNPPSNTQLVSVVFICIWSEKMNCSKLLYRIWRTEFESKCLNLWHMDWARVKGSLAIFRDRCVISEDLFSSNSSIFHRKKASKILQDQYEYTFVYIYFCMFTSNFILYSLGF